MQYIRKRLRNGLRVVLAPRVDVESTTVMIMTGAGSRYETARENGLAHFLEHMFFKGTQRRPTAQHISHELDAIGGEYNAFTGKDRTAYYAKVHATHAHLALDVVSDIFLHARLRKRDIDKERGAIIQEISMYNDMPSRDIYHVFDKLLYGNNHPLGWTVLGPKENILRFTRRDLQRYMQRCYTAHNTVICVAGKFNQGAMLKQIRADFAQMRDSAVPTFAPYTHYQKSPRIAVRNKKTDQTQLILGFPAYHSTHKDRYVLSVLATILGGGMSSRLFRIVREERGLAYSVYAGTERFLDAGAFYVKAGIEHKNLVNTVRLIVNELVTIRRRVVTSTELIKAKEYLKGHLVLGLETSDDVANYLIEQEVTHGVIRTPAEVMARIDAVSAADVKRVAQEIFVSHKSNLAVIGPHAGLRKELQSLLDVAY